MKRLNLENLYHIGWYRTKAEGIREKKAGKTEKLSVCKTAFILALGIGMAAGYASPVGLTSYAAEAVDTGRFVEGTIINGVGVSGLTIDEAKARIESYYYGNYTLKIRDKEGKQEIIHDTDIGYRMEIAGGLSEVLDQENAAGRLSGPSISNSYTVPVTVTYDEGLVQQEIERLAAVMGTRYTRNAYISAYEEGKPFEIVPEQYGNEFDKEALTAVVKNALNMQQDNLDLTDSGAYKTVTVTSQDEQLNNLCTSMNNLLGVTISYDFGDEREELSGSQIATWIRGNEGTTVLVDEAQVAAYVKSLADQYDTYGKPHNFHATAGYDVSVTGPYGWQINQAEETKALISAIQTCESQSREPIYSKSAASRAGNDYGASYVELDLTHQHLYLYENGSLIIDSPFVSGNVSKGWTTPDGIYPLTYKERNRVLRGRKRPDGTYEYESPVSYWMPFNGGIGLHDANWRGSFGGSIYKTNGSHGCVNLPVNIAPVVYDHIDTGYPIICHNQP